MILLLIDYVNLRRLHIYDIYDNAVAGKLFVRPSCLCCIKKLPYTSIVRSPSTNKILHTVTHKLPVFIVRSYYLNVTLEHIMLTKYLYLKETRQYDLL